MHSVLDFPSNFFMERDLEEDSKGEGCAVFNLKCSALEMKPGHVSLVWEPKSTAFTAGSQTAGIDSSIFENGCCPQQGKAKLQAAKLMEVFIWGLGNCSP